jgi:hypothetical protein
MLENEKAHVGPSSDHHRAGVDSYCDTVVLLQAVKSRDLVHPEGAITAGYSAERASGLLPTDQTRRVHIVTFVGDGSFDGPA